MMGRRSARVGSWRHEASGRRRPLRPDFSTTYICSILSIYRFPREATMPIAGIYGPEDFGNPRHGHPAPGCAAASALPTARARCRCRRWNGRPRSSAPPRISMSASSNVIPPVEWPLMAPYVKAINELKKERDAVILAHNYQTPEIFHCVADIVGDSLQLARRGHQGEGRHHRAVRRALHGGDLEDPQSATRRC